MKTCLCRQAGTQRGRCAVFHHWFFYRLRGNTSSGENDFLALVILCYLSVVASYRQLSAFRSLLIVYHYQIYWFETLRIAGEHQQRRKKLIKYNLSLSPNLYFLLIYPRYEIVIEGQSFIVCTTDSLRLLFFTHLLLLPALLVWNTTDSWGGKFYQIALVITIAACSLSINSNMIRLPSFVDRISYP